MVGDSYRVGDSLYNHTYLEFGWEILIGWEILYIIILGIRMIYLYLHTVYIT